MLTIDVDFVCCPEYLQVAVTSAPAVKPLLLFLSEYLETQHCHKQELENVALVFSTLFFGKAVARGEIFHYKCRTSGYCTCVPVQCGTSSTKIAWFQPTLSRQHT